MIEMRQPARRANLFAAALMSVGMLAGSPAAAQDDWVLDWSADALDAYDACLSKIPSDPETAYEDGLVFRDAGGGVLARHCIALALLEIGHAEEAAARLEEAAFMPDGGGPAMRAELLSQAGNAWLLAEAPIEAENAFNQALTTVSGDPDLFIDRSRALAMQNRFEGAVSDLSVALNIRPRDPMALKLRADALLELGRYEEALADVESALDIVPNDVSVLLVRGHIREAQRLSGS